MISLFASAKGFPDDVASSVETVVVDIREGIAEAEFRNLPYGEYALSVLHDGDGDGRMASSWLGSPREGFGFSGHPEYRFGQPEFADTSFRLTTPEREVFISMRYETERRHRQELNRQP